MRDVCVCVRVFISAKFPSEKHPFIDARVHHGVRVIDLDHQPS